MENLTRISVATNVCLEWLGTGRGPMRPDTESWIEATIKPDFAQDEIESECLESLRKLPFVLRKQMVQLLSQLAKAQ